MDDFSDKLGKILSDPKSMEQIMSLAKGLSSEKSEEKQAAPDISSMTDMLRSLVNSPAGQAFFNGEQQRIQLLKALSPYLSPSKRQKLSGVISAMESVSAVGSLTKLL